VRAIPVVEAAIETVRFAAEAKGIRLARALDAQAEPILGDPSRMQQVVWNLLSNAIKFTPSGGRVEVRLERDAGSVRIAVTDTGQGIDPSALQSIFARFRRGEGCVQASKTGLGLGSRS
jgi:signal transduction histidine kinase